MVYSKSFPRTIDGSNYPKWEEVFLTKNEEEKIDIDEKNENIKLFKECIIDAKKIISNQNLKEYQSDIINMAISLFEKRASHIVYHKETFAKNKFNE